MLEKKNIVISNEEIEYLGDLYIELKKDKEFNNKYNSFKEYVEAKMEEKLSSIRKENKNGS